MLVGAFLGDYVKGRLAGNFNPDIERGIRLHRAIDAYTDSHPTVRASQKRFQPPFRRYSGIILDIMFDYQLARSWENFYQVGLSDFSQHALSTLVEHADHLPARAEMFARRMHEMNSLSAHGEDRFLINSLNHLSTRLKRDNPLDSAYQTCQQLMPEVEKDFLDFYPALISFCESWKTEND